MALAPGVRCGAAARRSQVGASHVYVAAKARDIHSRCAYRFGSAAIGRSGSTPPPACRRSPITPARHVAGHWYSRRCCSATAPPRPMQGVRLQWSARLCLRRLRDQPWPVVGPQVRGRTLDRRRLVQWRHDGLATEAPRHLDRQALMRCSSSINTMQRDGHRLCGLARSPSPPLVVHRSPVRLDPVLARADSPASARLCSTSRSDRRGRRLISLAPIVALYPQRAHDAAPVAARARHQQCPQPGHQPVLARAPRRRPTLRAAMSPLPCHACRIKPVGNRYSGNHMPT
jgi:hypothetical protein